MQTIILGRLWPNRVKKHTCIYTSNRLGRANWSDLDYYFNPVQTGLFGIPWTGGWRQTLPPPFHKNYKGTCIDVKLIPLIGLFQHVVTCHSNKPVLAKGP